MYIDPGQIKLRTINLYHKVENGIVIGVRHMEVEPQPITKNMLLDMLLEEGVSAEKLKLIRFVEEGKDYKSYKRASRFYELKKVDRIIEYLQDYYKDIKPAYLIGGDKGLITIDGYDIKELISKYTGKENLKEADIKAIKMPSKRIGKYLHTALVRTLVCKPMQENAEYILGDEIKYLENKIDNNDGCGFMKASVYDTLFNPILDNIKIDACKVTGICKNNHSRIKGMIVRVPDNEWFEMLSTYVRAEDFYSAMTGNIDYITDSNQMKDIKGTKIISTNFEWIGLHQIDQALYSDGYISENMQSMRTEFDKALKDKNRLANEVADLFEDMLRGSESAKLEVLSYLDSALKNGRAEDQEGDEPTWAQLISMDIYKDYMITIRDVMMISGMPLNNRMVAKTVFMAMRGYFKDKVLKGKTRGFQGYILPIPQYYKEVTMGDKKKKFPIAVVYNRRKKKYHEGLAKFNGYPMLHQYCSYTVYCMSREEFIEKTGEWIPYCKNAILVPSHYTAFANRDFDGDPGMINIGKRCSVEKVVPPRFPKKPEEDNTEYTYLEELYNPELMRQRIGIFDSYLTAKVYDIIEEVSHGIRCSEDPETQNLIYDIAEDVQFRIDSAKGIDVDGINAKNTSEEEEYIPIMSTSGSTYRRSVIRSSRRLFHVIEDERTLPGFKRVAECLLYVVGYLYSNEKSNQQKLSEQYMNSLYIKDIDYASQITQLAKAIGSIIRNELNANQDSVDTFSSDMVKRMYNSVTSKLKYLKYDEEQKEFILIDHSKIDIIVKTLTDLAICNTADRRTNIIPFTIARDIGYLREVIEAYLDVCGKEEKWIMPDRNKLGWFPQSSMTLKIRSQARKWLEDGKSVKVSCNIKEKENFSVKLNNRIPCRMV